MRNGDIFPVGDAADDMLLNALSGDMLIGDSVYQDSEGDIFPVGDAVSNNQTTIPTNNNAAKPAVVTMAEKQQKELNKDETEVNRRSVKYVGVVNGYLKNPQFLGGPTSFPYRHGKANAMFMMSHSPHTNIKAEGIPDVAGTCVLTFDPDVLVDGLSRLWFNFFEISIKGSRNEMPSGSEVNIKAEYWFGEATSPYTTKSFTVKISNVNLEWGITIHPWLSVDNMPDPVLAYIQKSNPADPSSKRTLVITIEGMRWSGASAIAYIPGTRSGSFVNFYIEKEKKGR